MSCGGGVFFAAEKEAGVVVSGDVVIEDVVVGVAVAHGDADAVIEDAVLFGEGAADAPAEEDADIVLFEETSGDAGSL